MQRLLFSDLLPKKFVGQFDTPLASSDGGSPCARPATSCSVSPPPSSPAPDARLGSRIHHSCTDLLRQHVFSIALGYFDYNDSDLLRRDPALKLLLASQPTLPRFENPVRRGTLLHMAVWNLWSGAA